MSESAVASLILNCHLSMILSFIHISHVPRFLKPINCVSAAARLDHREDNTRAGGCKCRLDRIVIGPVYAETSRPIRFDTTLL